MLHAARSTATTGALALPPSYSSMLLGLFLNASSEVVTTQDELQPTPTASLRPHRALRFPGRPPAERPFINEAAMLVFRLRGVRGGGVAPPDDRAVMRLLVELCGRATSRLASEGSGPGAEWYALASQPQPPRRLMYRGNANAASLAAMAAAVSRSAPADDLVLRFLPSLAAAEAEAEAQAAAGRGAMHGNGLWRLTSETCVPSPPPPPAPPLPAGAPAPLPRAIAVNLLRNLGIRAPPPRARMSQAQLGALVYVHLRCDDVVRSLRVLSEASAAVAAAASATASKAAIADASADGAEAALCAAAAVMQTRLEAAAALIEDTAKLRLLPPILSARLRDALMRSAAAVTRGARWLGSERLQM